MSQKQQLLICGVTGFIGRNLVDYFSERWKGPIAGTFWKTKPSLALRQNKRLKLLKADLTNHSHVSRAIKGSAIVIQAAATTSGAKDIVTRPFIHVTDNAVMNSLILREGFEQKIKHLVFFSCTTMYPEGVRPVREDDFNYQIKDKYFGVGWTKVYIEKMCEFFSRISDTKFTVVRHSNIYGPHDKYDLERSHVFGATMTKVLTNPSDLLTVWGDGSDERDLLHVDDLVNFVGLALQKQQTRYELVNVGMGKSIAVKTLVEKIIRHSGRTMKIQYDTSKPSINYKLAVNIQKAKQIFGWRPTIDLDAGIQKTIAWYRQNVPATLRMLGKK
ncbi:MAG: hypothetical protein COV74_03055 [Candidatus Omnitrophica bacterium CG11_big_fil_rev_8_21_14_0_20_45_26]|uniref:NAD-dependent epimerase/dehydratase domain-containing protein n=1 Tax=Candidatus Abzuiibacterium crystallinum TaxID=1974748 RepID=A0A2H0LTK0_9BACT|nr:MAG: hypothetical protein COV74_03055 [Candidatus Omnitrophica bacterium CG11_big_fil_rev_8_21_14_0_20_45_26]PIW64655.1 MAG: hypothetical protein COW12_05080 [Candidatus Omnitrophica bacterium CG12_big_fil_rev_8_21_14_0_65_45_16]